MSRPVLLVGAAVAAVLLLLSAVTGVFWLGSRATSAALAERGVTTVAMVEAKRTNIRRVRTSDGTRRETDYLVTYAFEAVSPDGHETTERVIEHEVPRSIYNTLRSGQEVEIRYLPEDPRRGDFYPGEQQGTARVLGWAMAILLGSAVTSLMVAGVLSRRGERSSPARGRIQSV